MLWVGRCVLIKKHVRMEKTFEDELRTGLITPEEVEHFTKAVCSYSVVDGKKDRYPSRNRPALVFHMLHQATTDLYKAGHFPSFNHHLGIEQDITVLSNIFEEIEYLGCTIIPLPYAQLTRVVSLFYVISLPFGTAPALGWFTPLLTLAASLIYFTVDECASEMETPFEGRENDVDLEKMIRCRLAPPPTHPALPPLWAPPPSVPSVRPTPPPSPSPAPSTQAHRQAHVGALLVVPRQARPQLRYLPADATHRRLGRCHQDDAAGGETTPHTPHTPHTRGALAS